MGIFRLHYRAWQISTFKPPPINTKKPVDWKKSQRISLFHAYHQDRITDKVNTVAERVQLICSVLKEEIANRKIDSLKTLVDRIGHVAVQQCLAMVW